MDFDRGAFRSERFVLAAIGQAYRSSGNGTACDADGTGPVFRLHDYARAALEDRRDHRRAPGPATADASGRFRFHPMLIQEICQRRQAETLRALYRGTQPDHRDFADDGRTRAGVPRQRAAARSSLPITQSRHLRSLVHPSAHVPFPRASPE